VELPTPGPKSFAEVTANIWHRASPNSDWWFDGKATRIDTAFLDAKERFFSCLFEHPCERCDINPFSDTTRLVAPPFSRKQHRFEHTLDSRAVTNPLSSCWKERQRPRDRNSGIIDRPAVVVF
jgi:hypothetical protein